MTDMDVKSSYDRVDRRVQSQIREITESDLYTPHNKQLVLEFINRCRARNLSVHRICFYLDRLKKIAQLRRKDFKDWDTKDTEYVMAKLSERNYTANTIDDHKVCFKFFFRWVYGLESSDAAPKCVSWLKRENSPTKIRREDLLTRKDIMDMMNATNNPMHKALVSVFYAGPRPGEVPGIQMKDISEIDNRLIKIYVIGKMGKKMGERPLYLMDYLDEFRAWVRRHPKKHDPDALLFHCSSGPLNYANMEKIIKRMALRAGIMRYRRDDNGKNIRNGRGKVEIDGKKVWLYLFRHTAGTRYYGKYEGSYARRLMGHAAGSKMEAVYCHLSEQDIEARILGKNMPEDTEPDIQEFEKETDELLAIGKAIKKLSEKHPDVVDIEKLQGLLSH
jgi:site-specific recombinase XerD